MRLWIEPQARLWKYPISVGFCIFIWKIKTFLHLFKLPVWARQTYLRFSNENKKESLSISLAAINIIKGKAEKFSALLAKARKNVLWLNGRVHSYEQAQGVFLPSVINTEKVFLVFHPRRRRTTRLPRFSRKKKPCTLRCMPLKQQKNVSQANDI